MSIPTAGRELAGMIASSAVCADTNHPPVMVDTVTFLILPAIGRWIAIGIQPSSGKKMRSDSILICLGSGRPFLAAALACHYVARQLSGFPVAWPIRCVGQADHEDWLGRRSIPAHRTNKQINELN
ncbi:hypothetical protein SAMN05216338_1005119 [Bradyrhizobium sp. Rc2d]|nr:hypothetical protein SAMN05216338_1005119 [Bradyrhizobium sp. Rc2d]